MPAYPKKIPVNVGDGVVYIRLFGDEHNKRAETLDGYSLIQKSGEWYFAEKDAEGWLKPSVHKLSATLTDDSKQFLINTPKHLTNKHNVRLSNNYSIDKTSRSQSVHGNRRVLIILMQYSDLPMIKSQNDFNDLFNGIEYSADGAQGSVCDFYADVSYGQLQLSCDLVGPFTSKHDRKYYGGNNINGSDSNPFKLFEEAINYATELVTLNDYDADGDGCVDNIHIIFAGHGEEAGASDDAIWSHEATFYQDYEIQGMKINKYSCAPELRGNSGNGISRIGPHCHEIGHALGAMDYYDTDYETDGEYIGTGDWDIMASGSWNNEGITPADFNPYVKAYDFGWITPKDLPLGNVTIPPSYIDSNNYYILTSSYSTDYYLIENRSREKWGNGIPGEGMLVFHIHPEITSSGNNINSKTPQKCYVVCASSGMQRPGNTSSSYGDINSDGCPYPGSSNNTDFGQNSIPAAFFWNNEECDIELNNISIDAEGIICLENNNLGIGEEDVERKSVFFEGFENDDVEIRISNDADNSLSPIWAIESNPQEPSKFPKRPSAYKGSKSLQLSAKRVTEKAVSQFSFIIPEITDGSLLRLKLYANTLNPLADSPNIIQIGYRTKDNDEWQYSELISAENNLWHRFIVELPNNVLPEIKVEGTAFPKSVLAIDNLEVEEIIKKNESGIQETRPDTNGIISVFSLSGIKQNHLQKGINIIRLPNGVTIKTFSK
ncbi:MAG: M6 family metalloprotease domain-containing protein [Prevotellaceae bacterium]|nr:M6 family metalloprotease domain-containing protein [Prevotellaceae bacterium]